MTISVLSCRTPAVVMPPSRSCHAGLRSGIQGIPQALDCGSEPAMTISEGTGLRVGARNDKSGGIAGHFFNAGSPNAR